MLGPWLKGSDQDALESAWYQLSGTIGVPLVSGTYQEDPKYRTTHLASQNAAYIFGTITFENLSPDRDPEEFMDYIAGGHMDVTHVWLEEVGLTPEEQDMSKGVGRLFWCTQDRCLHLAAGASGWIPFDLTFDGNQTTGPIPFVAAVPEVFGHHRPGCNPDLTNHCFRLTFPAAERIDPPGQPVVGDRIPTTVSWEE